MARKAARHRRRRRFTPRRWLPFLLLCGLVAVAAVVESEPPAPDVDALAQQLDLRGVPTVTAEDAISTAFYCSGGTAIGEGGAAELALVLANDDDRGAVADITLVGPEGVAATTQLEVPANGRARLRASEVMEAEWAGALVEVRGGRVAVDREVSGPLGFDAAPCPTEAAARWYVGSGSTVRGATMYLSFFNPFPDPASVDVTLATESGRRRPRALDGLSVPGRSVRVVAVGENVTDRDRVAATVTTRSGRVVVDHVQTYDGTGDALVGTPDETDGVPKGLVSVPGATTRAPVWTFPGIRITAGTRTQLALYNPGREAARVDVSITNQDPERSPEIEPIGVTVPGREQLIVDLVEIADELPADGDVWVEVRSLDGVGVVAERLSFFGDPAPRRGAAVSPGLPVASERWMVTQAGATELRSGGVQVANPGDRDADITVLALQDGDQVELAGAATTIPAGDRRALDLGEADAAATVVVVSSAPVVVSSSLAVTSGQGLALQPGIAYPEAIVPLR